MWALTVTSAPFCSLLIVPFDRLSFSSLGLIITVHKAASARRARFGDIASSTQGCDV